MNDAAIGEALLTEYREMRAELRTVLTMCYVIINAGLVLIASIVWFAIEKVPEGLFLIPTTLFILTMILLTQAAQVSVLGTYCMALSRKIKAHFGQERVVFQWESGRIWKLIGHPLAPVFLGIYAAIVPVTIGFGIISWLAFRWHPWTLIVHALELVIFVIFGAMILRLNNPKIREQLLRESVDIAVPDLPE